MGGADILRVHDVREAVETIRLVTELKSDCMTELSYTPQVSGSAGYFCGHSLVRIVRFGWGTVTFSIFLGIFIVFMVWIVVRALKMELLGSILSNLLA